MTTPPRPQHAPTNGSGWTTTAPQTPRQGTAPNAAKNVNKTRNGGGFNPSLNLTPNINVTKNTGNGSSGAARGNGAGHSKVPGSDFMSNEDIRAYCEYRRKQMRELATEVAMDIDYLEAALATIPDENGSRSGARARSRRVGRPGKRSAAALKNCQKYFAQVFGTFEREYDSALRKVGKGRIQQQNRVVNKFNWR